MTWDWSGPVTAAWRASDAVGGEQWEKKNSLQFLFVCCWPSRLSVCVVTSFYRHYLCCDNTLGFWPSQLCISPTCRLGYVCNDTLELRLYSPTMCETYAVTRVSIVLNTPMVSSVLGEYRWGCCGNRRYSPTDRKLMELWTDAAADAHSCWQNPKYSFLL